MSSNGHDHRRFFLGMPGYAQGTAGATRAFWRASSGKVRIGGVEHAISGECSYNQFSLLANSFNLLWCEALNRAYKGERVDYFAMLHSDCEALDGWLDALIEELEAKNLDVLSVVVPLKDQNGLTSTALARPDGDPWRVHSRLTMHEVYRLPETFTAADVGYPLLLNTGCWVCRFNPEWAYAVHFEINDRICLDTKLGQWVPQVEPEDWNFSRQLNRLGLRIGATRKVALEHAGTMRFSNGYPWGAMEFDHNHVTESVVPKAGLKSGIKFPHDVDGWLLPVEGDALAELARGKRVLEIGSYCGRSTICLAQTAASVVAVDPHDGRGTPRPRNTFEEFQANLARYGVADVVLSANAIPPVKEPFDLAFIDGAHDVESVRRDTSAVRDRLATGGLIAFHDYRQNAGQHDGNWDPGVTQAVNELLSEGGELISTHATVAVVRPPANVPLEV